MIRPASLRLATFAALAAGLLLAGCGRKGPLDPPPGAWAVPPSTNSMTSVSNKVPEPAPPAYDEQGKPIAPAGLKRRIPADALID